MMILLMKTTVCELRLDNKGIFELYWRQKQIHLCVTVRRIVVSLIRRRMFNLCQARGKHTTVCLALFSVGKYTGTHVPIVQNHVS